MPDLSPLFGETRPAAAAADGAGPGQRPSARAAGHVGRSAGPVRSRDDRLYERGDGALSPGVRDGEPLDLSDRRHGTRGDRGGAGLASWSRATRCWSLNFGRFGLLLSEILDACRRQIETVDAPWGEVVPMDEIADAIARHAAEAGRGVHGDTSTTMAQPLDGLGDLCREAGALSYVDATATLGGMEVEVDPLGGGCRQRRPAEMHGRPARARRRSPCRSAPRSASSRGATSRLGLRRDETAGRQGPAHRLQLFRSGDGDGLLVGEAPQPPYRGHHHALRRAGMRAAWCWPRGWSAASPAMPRRAAR